MPKNDGSVTVADAEIFWLNFSGKEAEFNREGDRNFNLLLEDRIAKQMEADGWNVKYTKEREVDGETIEPRPFIKVKVNYGGFKDPQITMVGDVTKSRTVVTEQTVALLDDVEIKTVDLRIRPYNWEVRGETGITAYLDKMYVEIIEDELDLKWAEEPVD